MNVLLDLLFESSTLRSDLLEEAKEYINETINRLEELEKENHYLRRELKKIDKQLVEEFRNETRQNYYSDPCDDSVLADRFDSMFWYSFDSITRNVARLF